MKPGGALRKGRRKDEKHTHPLKTRVVLREESEIRCVFHASSTAVFALHPANSSCDMKIMNFLWQWAWLVMKN